MSFPNAFIGNLYPKGKTYNCYLEAIKQIRRNPPDYVSITPNLSIQAVDSRQKHSGMTAMLYNETKTNTKDHNYRVRLLQLCKSGCVTEWMRL